MSCYWKHCLGLGKHPVHVGSTGEIAGLARCGYRLFGYLLVLDVNLVAFEKTSLSPVQH